MPDSPSVTSEARLAVVDHTPDAKPARTGGSF